MRELCGKLPAPSDRNARASRVETDMRLQSIDLPAATATRAASVSRPALRVQPHSIRSPLRCALSSLTACKRDSFLEAAAASVSASASARGLQLEGEFRFECECHTQRELQLRHENAQLSRRARGDAMRRTSRSSPPTPTPTRACAARPTRWPDAPRQESRSPRPCSDRR